MRLDTIKKVRKAGNSLVIPLTKELRVMNIKEGDLIKISVEPLREL